MSEIQLNREKYDELISEDIEWLRQQPETHWRNHIECVLRESSKLIYSCASKTPIYSESRIKLMPEWILINAIRYAFKKPASVVSDTCRYIIDNWFLFDEITKKQIRNDVNDAFSDYSRCKNLPNLRHCSPLGKPCDIKEWENVRKLWRK
jgi:hypothetical protein